MTVAILSNLSEEEAWAFIAHARRRHPAILLISRGGVGPRSHEILADEDDAAAYADVIESLVTTCLPARFTVARMEEKITGFIGEMLATGSFEPGSYKLKTPLFRLCEELEHCVVPRLLPVGDISDGFTPNTITPIERGVSFEGICWFFEEPCEGRFRAEIALDGNGVLERFDLRFGDTTSMGSAHSCDITGELAHGYRITRHSYGPRAFTWWIVKEAATLPGV